MGLLARLMTARHRRLILAAFCLLCWLPGFFTIPASDRDESRFVQATRQMLETGDYVDIRNGTEARNRKPIGIYWLQAPGAATARALGLAQHNPVWPYRLPSLLGAMLGVFATEAIGRRLFGPRAGMLAGLMLGGSVLLTVEAHIAKTDAALLGVTTLAMALLAAAWDAPATFRRWQAALFWLALGAGILIKGPITPMVVGLAVIALLFMQRQPDFPRALRAGWGVPLMLLVVLPWFIAIGIATDGKFFVDAVGGDLGGKLAGGKESHWGPPLEHLLLLPLLFFPFTIPVLAAIPAIWQARRARWAQFLIAWVLPAWLVFEAVPTKLPHYPLPLYPALALAAAALIERGLAVPRWMRVAAPLAFGGAGLVIAAAALALPVAAEGWSGQLWLAAPVILAVAIMLGLTRRAVGFFPQKAAFAACAAALVVPLLYWSLLGLELPGLRPLWLSSQVATVLAERAPGAEFGAAGDHEPSLMFAAGTATRLLDDGAAAARFLQAAPPGARVALITQGEARQFADTAKQLRVQAVPLARLSGFNYSRGRRQEVTLLARAADAPAPGGASAPLARRRGAAEGS